MNHATTALSTLPAVRKTHRITVLTSERAHRLGTAVKGLPGEKKIRSAQKVRQQTVTQINPWNAVAFIYLLSIGLAYLLCNGILPSSQEVAVVEHAAPKEVAVADLDPQYAKVLDENSIAVEVAPQTADLYRLSEKQLLWIVSDKTQLSGTVIRAIDEIAIRKLPRLLDIAPLLSMHHVTEVRLALARALGEFRDSQAVATLITMLADTDARVRAVAAEQIAKIGSRSAIPYLSQQAEGEPNPATRQTMKLALDTLNGFPS